MGRDLMGRVRSVMMPFRRAARPSAPSAPPRTRLIPIVLFLILALILAPGAWLLTARIAGVRLTQQADPLGLLTTFGGIMAAVFTVGGLVTALAAVVAVLTVEERVRRTIEEQMPDLERRADTQIQAYLLARASLDASVAANVEEVVSRTEEALRLYPGVHHARSDLGLRLAWEVLKDFIRDHGNTSIMWQPQPGERAALRAESVRWLKEALTHGDEREGQVQAALAVVYGIEQRYDAMIAVVRRVAADYPEQRPYLLEAPQLIALAYACGANEARLRELGDAVGWSLPRPAEEERASLSLQALRPSWQSGVAIVDWTIVGRPDAWQPTDLARFPVVMKLRRDMTAPAGSPDTSLGGGLETFANLPPAFTNALGQRDADELIADLDGSVYFLCQTPQMWFGVV